jgi:alpha-beta hydrolase superfamily lysophospholipase
MCPLAGHSMGGLIAMKIALNKDIAIEKLILCAPRWFLNIIPPHESMLF